jgi:hypothetical protein
MKRHGHNFRAHLAPLLHRRSFPALCFREFARNWYRGRESNPHAACAAQDFTPRVRNRWRNEATRVGIFWPDFATMRSSFVSDTLPRSIGTCLCMANPKMLRKLEIRHAQEKRQRAAPRFVPELRPDPAARKLQAARCPPGRAQSQVGR